MNTPANDDSKLVPMLLPGSAPNHSRLSMESMASMRAKGYKVFSHNPMNTAEAEAVRLLLQAAKLQVAVAVTESSLPTGVLALIYRGPEVLGDATLLMSRKDFSPRIMDAARAAFGADFVTAQTVSVPRVLQMRTDSTIHTPEGEIRTYWMSDVIETGDATKDESLKADKTARARAVSAALAMGHLANIGGFSVRWRTYNDLQGIHQSGR